MVIRASLFGSFLMLLLSPFCASAIDLDRQFESIKEQDRFLIETLKSMGREINQQTPLWVDSDTRLNSVLVLGKTLTYNYQLINFSGSDLDVPFFMRTVLENLNHMVCQSEATRTLIDLGVRYVYLYSGMDGKLITRIVLESYQCGRL